MNAYIYNSDRMVVAIITGETKPACKAKAFEFGFTGGNEYGLSYNNNGLTTTEDTPEYYA